MLLLLVPLLLQDTLRIDAQAAMARALERAPAVAAATARSRAVTAAGRDAGRLANPHIAVLAENLGMQQETTGLSGLRGTEGQVTLQGVLPLGGDLGASRRGANAQAMLASIEAAGVEDQLRGELLIGIAAHILGHEVIRSAVAEADVVAQLAQAVTVRAAEGRSSSGDAARARTEAMMITSQVARRRAMLSAADRELAVVLGVPVDTPIRITLPLACEAPAAGAPLGVQRAGARQTLAEALEDRASANRVPDLVPQIGLRRSGGFSGLIVGLAVEFPLFSTGAGARDAARAEVESARLEMQQAEQDREARIAGSLMALRELETLASRYAGTWESDLELAVSAAVARWNEGQGTLAELLDAHRSRQLARDEHTQWQLQRVSSRIALARALGTALTSSVISDTCSGAQP